MTNNQPLYLNGLNFDNNHVNLMNTISHNNNHINFKDFVNASVAAAATTPTSLEDSVNNNSQPFHINHSQRVKSSNFATSAGVAIIKSEPIECEGGGDTKINKENDGEFFFVLLIFF